jgi:hypothetical protein
MVSAELRVGARLAAVLNRAKALFVAVSNP